nr:MAG TPA: hypothetical protein [Caudoviricetes sp.]
MILKVLNVFCLQTFNFVFPYKLFVCQYLKPFTLFFACLQTPYRNIRFLGLGSLGRIRHIYVSLIPSNSSNLYFLY